MRCLVWLFVIMLTSCTSPSKLAHFPEDAFYPYWHYLDYAELLDDMGQTSLRSDGPDAYRLTIFSGVTPMHAIRIDAKDGGGMATITIMEKGYRMAGPNRLESEWMRKVASTRIRELDAMFASVGFAEGVSDPGWDEDELCMHPTYFLFERRQANTHHFIIEDVCNATGLTLQGGPAFYRAADIGSSDDLSLAEWFGMEEGD